MAVEPNADEADPQVLSVDTFLYEDGVYAFSPERVELAKKLCFERLKLLVQSGQCRRIICTCGCPGAGKSTWIAAHGREERAVFFDDLLYTARHRTQFLQNLKSYEIEERDFEAALASNSARPADRQVPLEAMQKFRDNYTRPGEDEGFCRVRVFCNSFEDKTGHGGFNLEVQAEALRQMQEVSCKLPDLRSEGDSHWLANGAQVELHGLQKAQTLNGLRGEIIGFDDKQLRYRVRLHSDNTVKVVAKKNLRLLTLEDLQPAPMAAPATQLSGSTRSLPAPSQSRDLVPAGAPQMPGPPVGRITREMVLKAVDRVKVDTVALQQRIAARQAGGGMTTSDICDVYLRLVASEESYREVKELYQRQNGRDEELELLGNAALESSEVVAEQYFEVRSWQEYFQDEVNVTKYSVKKHGILGTLKNEVPEVGNDVKDLGRGAATVVQSGREQVPHLVRAATDTVGNVVQTGSAAAASTGASFAARSQEHLTTAVHETVVAPVKRAWHMMATGFILCVLVPLFALRTYAPLNSVVSNLGLLWLLICTCCPPRGMNGRAGKSALLLLYPLIIVVLPLALHYWATHPQLSQDVGDMFRRLPEQLGRIPEQLKELPGINKLRCSDNDQSYPTPREPDRNAQAEDAVASGNFLVHRNRAADFWRLPAQLSRMFGYSCDIALQSIQNAQSCVSDTVKRREDILIVAVLSHVLSNALTEPGLPVGDQLSTSAFPPDLSEAARRLLSKRLDEKSCNFHLLAC
eukprot:s2028_g7.t3